MSWINGVKGRCQCDHCGDMIGSKEKPANASSIFANITGLKDIHFCNGCNEKLNLLIKPNLVPFLKVPESCDVTEFVEESSLDEVIQFFITMSAKGYKKIHLDYDNKINLVK